MEPDPSQKPTEKKEKGQQTQVTAGGIQIVHQEKNSSACEWSSTGTGCPGWLQHPHPWTYSKPDKALSNLIYC